MKGLQIGERGFALPLEVAGETTAILAKRGAGKTHTGIVIAEELHAAGVQFVVLDPVGAWWGLRSKLEVPIIGGQHGDLELSPAAGKLLADVVVESGQSLVLETSDFPSKAKVAGFVTDFLDHLYRRLAKEPRLLHVFLEEADEYAPQRPFKEETRMLSAVEQVVRRGRGRGLGITMITQRSASLNKNVLEQADVLIAMRTTGPNDRKAVESWVQKHDDGGAGDQVIASLPSLGNGEAWVWNPERGLLERIKVRARRTLDVSGRLKPGETRANVKMKPIDLDALGARIAETVERQRENDPAELKKRVRELERKLAAGETAATVETVVETVEVPVLTDEMMERVVESVAPAVDALAEIKTFVNRFGELCTQLADVKTGARGAPGRVGRLTSDWKSPRKAPVPPPPPPRAEASNGGGPEVKYGKGERTVLEVLAEYPDGRTVNELAFLAGYSAKASTIGVILSNLRKAGYVGEGNQPVRPTQAGLDRVGGARERPTGEALLDYWLRHPRMGKGEREVLLTLLEQDGPIGHDELADRTGYSPIASTLGVILSNLRKLGLVQKGSREVAPEFREAVGR